MYEKHKIGLLTCVRYSTENQIRALISHPRLQAPRVGKAYKVTIRISAVGTLTDLLEPAGIRY